MIESIRQIWGGEWSGPWGHHADTPIDPGGNPVNRPTCLTCPYWDASAAGKQAAATNPYYMATCVRYPFAGVVKQAQQTCGEHTDYAAYVASLKAPVVNP